MAIGDYGNNNSRGNNGKAYEATYYSRVKFKGLDSKQLSISFRSGLMILDIAAVSDGFKVDSLITIYLSPVKAHLLATQIDEFLAYRAGNDIDPNKGFGVNAGMGEKITYIAFSTNDNKDINITIGKFDGQGVVTESQILTLNRDYNYSLEWSNLSSNELTRVFDNDVEIIMLRNAIRDFSNSMLGSQAYACADITRFTNAHIEKRIDEIFDKLGIERRSYGGNNNYSNSNNSFLSNSSSKSTSIEEVEDLLV